MEKSDVTSTKLSDFLIMISTSGKRIRLIGIDGCEWKEIKFVNNGKPHAINQNGLTLLEGKPVEGKSALSDFIFTIEITAEEVKLKGGKGIAWTELNFGWIGYGCKQAIDQKGLV